MNNIIDNGIVENFCVSQDIIENKKVKNILSDKIRKNQSL